MNHAPPGVESPDAFIRWFLDNRIDRFDLAVQRRDPDGHPVQFLAPAHTGHQDLDAARFQRLIPWLRAENAQGADIYFRVHRYKSWPAVFLDDIPTPLARRIAHKYTANILETSAACTHLWLATTIPLDCRQRMLAQKYLVSKLGGLADPGSVSGDHWGRLPGMRNRKPHRNCWVNLLVQSRHLPWPPIFTQVPSGQHISPCPDRPRDKKPLDPSRQEWGWVMGALESGMTPSRVVERLIAYALPRRGRDARRYAYHTVRRACRKLGLSPP